MLFFGDSFKMDFACKKKEKEKKEEKISQQQNRQMIDWIYHQLG